LPLAIVMPIRATTARVVRDRGKLAPFLCKATVFKRKRGEKRSLGVQMTFLIIAISDAMVLDVVRPEMHMALRTRETVPIVIR